MSQHDFVIDNQNAPASRADINNALQALASLSSGTTAPVATYANMLWYDTANDLIKIRNEANSAWITLGTVDQTNNVFSPNFPPATQAEAEAGVENTKSMTALRVAQAIAALVPPALGNNPAAGNVVIQELTPVGLTLVIGSYSSSSSATGALTSTYYASLGVRTALKSGSIRIKGTLSASELGPVLRIYKNQVVAATITGAQTFSTDITIAPGDSITFGGTMNYQIGTSGGSDSISIANLTINADAFVLWGV